MIMKYQVGDTVWRASWDSSPAYIECQDCAGTARVRVMLADDTIVSLECEGCKRGYNPATGQIQVYSRAARALQEIITGCEVDGGKTQWRTNGNYRAEEEHLFDNEADALAKALEYAAECDQEERDRVSRKEKPLKSWAWHAHYHRKRIKDAQRDIEYHTLCLAVASVKAKEDKKTAALSSAQRVT